MLLKKVVSTFAGLFATNQVLEETGNDTLVDIVENIDLDDFELNDLSLQNQIQNGVENIMEGPMNKLRDSFNDVSRMP